MKSILTVLLAILLIYVLGAAAHAAPVQAPKQCFSEKEITEVKQEVNRLVGQWYLKGQIDGTTKLVNDIAKLCEKPGAYIQVGPTTLRCPVQEI